MAKLNQKDSIAMRDAELAFVKELYENAGLKVMITASGDVAIAREFEGQPFYSKISASVPKGPRDGDGWDAEADAEFYASEVIRKEAEAKITAEKKAKKIAKDTADREAKKANQA